MKKVKIGKTLREIRENKEYTQEYVAYKLNSSKSSISKYENDNGDPSFDVLIALANLYDVSLDYIFSRDRFIVLENDDNYYFRVSKKMFKLISILLRDDNSDLLDYILADPEQSVRQIASRLEGYY